jgi:hypothetical protein
VVVATLAEAGGDAAAAKSTSEEERASVHRRESLSHFDAALRANDGSFGCVKPTKPYVIRFYLRSIS